MSSLILLGASELLGKPPTGGEVGALPGPSDKVNDQAKLQKRFKRNQGQAPGPAATDISCLLSPAANLRSRVPSSLLVAS